MFNFADWHLKDAQISARGAKSCTLQKGPKCEKITFSLGEQDAPVSSPFGATSFNDEANATSRRTIEFNLTPEQEEIFQAFDNWACSYLSENSERIFRKALSIDQIREGYRSPVTKKGSYRGHLRCKINLSGTAAVRCWDEKRQRITIPPDLRNCELIPRISISHLWLMSREYGWVFQVNDLQVIQSEEECPF